MPKEIKRPVKAAMQKARSEIYLEASGKVKSQGWTFANINDIYKAVIEPLEKYGCTVNHQRFIQDASLCMRTTIEHLESGDSIEDVCFIESEKPGNQGLGIATTYMKKDAIRCLLGLPSKDDDGQDEQEHIKVMQEKQASEFNVNELQKLINQTSNPDKMLSQILHYNKVDSLDELGEQQCSRAAYRVREIIKAK